MNFSQRKQKDLNMRSPVKSPLTSQLGLGASKVNIGLDSIRQYTIFLDRLLHVLDLKKLSQQIFD